MDILIKEIGAKTFFCAEKFLTVAEIPDFAEDTLDLLFTESGRRGLDLDGPVEFIYMNSNVKPGEKFQIFAALPVKEKKGASGEFFFMEALPFQCAYTDFVGPMLNIGEAWQTFMNEVLNAGYLTANQGREVYKTWLDFDSTENITELQLGVCARKNSI